MKDRIRILREVDGIMANAYQYVLLWYGPYTRLLWWNRFGAPSGYLLRTGDYSSMYSLWWIDPAKDAQLKQALRNPSQKLEVGPEEDRYWLDYGKKEQPLQPKQRKAS
jgi:hypothetical protein